MTKKLYMKVTQDKFELPICVCSSVPELAARCGVQPNSIWQAIARAKRRPSRKSIYRVVEIEEDES